MATIPSKADMVNRIHQFTLELKQLEIAKDDAVRNHLLMYEKLRKEIEAAHDMRYVPNQFIIGGKLYYTTDGVLDYIADACILPLNVEDTA